MKYFTKEELQPSEKTLSFIRQIAWRRLTTAISLIALANTTPPTTL